MTRREIVRKIVSREITDRSFLTLSLSMERNYDEIISEMLMQIDRHSEELKILSAEMTKQSLRTEESYKWFVQEIKGMKQTDAQLQHQIVHSATILDRIIKKNELKL